MNQSPDYARVLLQKARDDEYAVRILASDEAAPEWTGGFHAQQAVEKAIKAVLSAAGADVPKTHDLQRLLNLLAAASLAAPPRADELLTLSPYGAVLRYDEEPEMEGGKGLDRAWVLAAVRRTIEWAETSLTST
jgi:HEPN domain-containing protein